MSVTAIVLAGGRSSRFGSAKLAAELDGRSLLDHVIEAVAAVASETIVVIAPTGPPPRLPSGVRIVRDRDAFGGPLAGVAVGLEVATGEVALVVGGDMPRLRPRVLEAMLAALGTAGNAPAAVVLEADGDPSPLPAAIQVEPARIAIMAALASGRRSLRALLDGLAVHAVPEEEWRGLDPAGDTLVDIDRPEDLERVRAFDPDTTGLT